MIFFFYTILNGFTSSNNLYSYTERDLNFELLESSNSLNFAFIILPSFRHNLTNAGQLELYVTKCLDLHDNLGLLGEPRRVVATGGCLGWTTLSQPPSVTNRSK